MLMQKWTREPSFGSISIVSNGRVLIHLVPLSLDGKPFELALLSISIRTH